MSSQTPRAPGPRRRIAGERRTRTVETDDRSGAQPSESAGSAGSAETSERTQSTASPLSRAPMQPEGAAQPATSAQLATPAEARSLRGPSKRDRADRAGDGTGTAVRAPTPRRRPAPSWRVIAALGTVAALLVALTAVLGLGTWSYPEVRDQDRAQEAARTAPAVAERAAAAVLSYDYRSLSADEKSAARYLTPSFRAQYLKSMSLVRPNAPKLKARVVADVKASGVSNPGADRVDVLVYVNQTTTSTANGGDPQIALNRAMFSMVRRDGTWLVDNITSY